MTPPRKRKPVRVSKSVHLERVLATVARLSPEELKLFEPWFRSRQESNEIRRTKTVPELHRWRAYYDHYGCLMCGKNKRMHYGLGFCQPCRETVARRLKEILEDMERNS